MLKPRLGCPDTYGSGAACGVGLPKMCDRLRLFATVCAVVIRGILCAKNEFIFSLDLFASDTGYFKVEGFEGVQPALSMQRNVKYTFLQADQTNWYHPLGFAYFPDGEHEGKDELETGVRTGDTPVYLIDGKASDLEDAYEPQFTYPRDFWLKHNYSVEVTVTDPDLEEIFYFCHTHNKMSGRIKILDSPDDEPGPDAIALYEPSRPAEFDRSCGTFGASAYEPSRSSLQSELCPAQRFLCGNPRDKFTRCMQAVNCQMNHQMRVNFRAAKSPTASFMHQMIPHHDNAVNMAKILLKTVREQQLDEEVLSLIYEVINSQNAQITFMRTWLAEHDFDEGEICADVSGGRKR